MSWQHFQYGLAGIAREDMRNQLQMAQAMRMTHVNQEDWNAYQHDVMRMTEVPRGR